jgi:hypothetical protein
MSTMASKPRDHVAVFEEIDQQCLRQGVPASRDNVLELGRGPRLEETLPVRREPVAAAGLDKNMVVI